MTVLPPSNCIWTLICLMNAIIQTESESFPGFKALGISIIVYTFAKNEQIITSYNSVITICICSAWASNPLKNSHPIWRFSKKSGGFGLHLKLKNSRFVIKKIISSAWKNFIGNDNNGDSFWGWSWPLNSYVSSKGKWNCIIALTWNQTIIGAGCILKFFKLKLECIGIDF